MSRAQLLFCGRSVWRAWLALHGKTPRVTGGLIVSRDPSGPGELCFDLQLCWHEVCPLTGRTRAVSEAAFIQLSLGCLLSAVGKEYPDFRVFGMPFTHHSRVPSHISHLPRTTIPRNTLPEL